MITPLALEGAKALATIGHDARFSEVQETIGRGVGPTNDRLKAALSAGYATRTGTPGTIKSRWILTVTGERAIQVAEEPTAERAGSRDAIQRILAREGVVPDARALAALLSHDSTAYRTMGTHSLQHQLHSMRKQGLIEFSVSKNGPRQTIQNIRVATVRVQSSPLKPPQPRSTPLKPAQTASTPLKPAQTASTPLKPAQTASTPLNVAQATSTPAWPQLLALRSRVESQGVERRRSDRLLDAAELLADVDPEESERLFTRGSEIAAGLTQTALEAEYLRYAEHNAIEAIRHDG